MAVAFLFFSSSTADGQAVYRKHIRWMDPNPNIGGGFVLHIVGPSGDIEDVVYPIENPELGRHGNVYGVFLDIDEGETCVAVSRFGDTGEWSDSSRTWCFRHDDPETPLCQRADLNRDGIVGGPDYSLFASVFGQRCE